MKFEEIIQLVITVFGALGGISGILLLIKSIASIISAWKNGATAKQIKALIESQSQKDLDTIRQGLIDGLNCQFDINITDKFKEMFLAQFAEMRAFVEQNQKQTSALKTLMCHIAEMYQRSKSLTADERAELGKAIEAAKNTIIEPITAPKPTVQITYTPKEDTVEVVEQTVVKDEDYSGYIL